MIETHQYTDVISREFIDKNLEYYKSINSYDTTLMNKASPGELLSSLVELCIGVTGLNLEYKSGNFYSHTVPYLPHTDYKTTQNNTINIVIPLEYTGTLPSLVIFDQTWELDSITWCMHHKVQYFTTNIGVKGSPYEYPVNDLTGKEFDEKLYNSCLTHYPKSTLYGLSGKSYPFEPGSIIVFDNRKIHCTSIFSGSKTGVSLRFKINE